MVISEFCFIVLRMDSWSVVRLGIGGCVTKEELMALLNRWTLVSITRDGGGGRQFDFIRRVFEVEA